MGTLLRYVAVVVLVMSTSCGGNDNTSTGDPLVDAFADQLTREAGAGWFTALESADTVCFATNLLDTIGQQRQTELGITADNIPWLFEADWTDAELDLATDIFDPCVDDVTGTGAFVSSVFGGSDRYQDCMVPEITTRLGDRYWFEQFRATFTPPRIEQVADQAARAAQQAGVEPAPAAVAADIEPVMEACVPGYPPEYAQDACGGEPCEDPPDSADLRRIVLECSRDPYVDVSFYGGSEGLDEWSLGPDACQQFGRGALVGVALSGYPCPDGPRDIELTATGETITEQTIADACAR